MARRGRGILFDGVVFNKANYTVPFFVLENLGLFTLGASFLSCDNTPMKLRPILYRFPMYVVLIYIILCAALYCVQDRLLFPREPGKFSECPSMKTLGAVPKEIEGLRFYEKATPENKTTLVVFHGNGGTACDRSWLLSRLQKLPLNFIFIEYPGYAQDDPSSPSPSEKAILTQTGNLMKLLDGKRLILFGESIGSGVATFAASFKSVAGVILQSPYTSLADVGQFHYKWFPVRYLTRNSFNAEVWAHHVLAPVLVLRADKDEVIPTSITEAQIRNFPKNVQVVNFTRSSHNSMEYDDPELYWRSVEGFIRHIVAE